MDSRRHRLDQWFGSIIRLASVLVLLAIAGVILQMVTVAQPLFSTLELRPSNSLAPREYTALPGWVPASIRTGHAVERNEQRLWFGINKQGEVKGGAPLRGQSHSDVAGWQQRPIHIELGSESFDVSHVAIDPSWHWLLLVSSSAEARLLSIDAAQRVRPTGLRVPLGQVSGLIVMPGGRSFITWANRCLQQWHWRYEAGRDAPTIEVLRQKCFMSAITTVAAAPAGQRVAIGTLDTGFTIWHSTSDRILNQTTMAAAIDFLFWVSAERLEVASGTQVIRFDVPLDAGSVSMNTLLNAVHYEGYAAANHRWLPLSDNESEPKFGLRPLIFGTLKAAAIAMFIAVPLGLGAAIFVGFFISPRVRDRVKPVLELLAAFPSVVLGALMLLAVAPVFLDWLPGLLGACLVTPIGVCIVSFILRTNATKTAERGNLAWLPVMLTPLILVLAGAGYLAGQLFNQWIADGNFALWLETSFGMVVVHRNALLVGFAMGIAVMPLVFSLAEDAIHSVAPLFSAGALALGATHWQSYRDVALPVATPGIVAAVMIGFGRAVGETMIVLLLAANTPLMELNVLDGMRTVSATIALELSETPFESTHYRVLFAGGLALFILTFVINSLAEAVRSRASRRLDSSL